MCSWLFHFLCFVTVRKTSLNLYLVVHVHQQFTAKFFPSSSLFSCVGLAAAWGEWRQWHVGMLNWHITEGGSCVCCVALRLRVNNKIFLVLLQHKVMWRMHWVKPGKEFRPHQNKHKTRVEGGCCVHSLERRLTRFRNTAWKCAGRVIGVWRERNSLLSALRNLSCLTPTSRGPRVYIHFWIWWKTGNWSEVLRNIWQIYKNEATK